MGPRVGSPGAPRVHAPRKSGMVGCCRLRWAGGRGSWVGGGKGNARAGDGRTAGRGRGHQTAGLERSPHWEHHVRHSAIEACYTRACVPAAAKEDDTKSPSPSPQREPSLPPRCRHDLGWQSPMRAIAPATSRAFARLRTLTEYVRPSCQLLLCFSRIRAPFSVGWYGLYQATIGKQ